MTAPTPGSSSHAKAAAILAEALGRSGVIEVPGLNVGKAKPERCPDCSGTGRCRCKCQSTRCCGCGGKGYQLWRACPNCGDIAWDGLGNGKYACRISCGFRWTEDHPGWQIQRLPGEED